MNDQVAPPSDAFHFGENWQRYVATQLSPERERIAAESIRALLEVELTDRTFLDIGCGSGLFSLCAYKAGVQRVTSIDVDPDSVAATQSLRDSVGAPDNWNVIHGSILDPMLVDGLDRAEIVYSWGVLHHTGNMYAAISNASGLVSPGGLFAIAIYNRVTSRLQSSERWLAIKRAYNHSPRPVQLAMEGAYRAYFTAAQVAHGRNPRRVAREYKSSRGMALKTDLRDWLGGYPYEFATAAEIQRFVEHECGLRARKVLDVGPRDLGNNEFVFDKPS